MKQRGRKSTNSLLTTGVAIPGDNVQRAQVPEELDDDEAAEWCAVVERMPVNWFPRETYGVLTQYCRHVVRARKLAVRIRDLEKQGEFTMFGQAAPVFDLKTYNILMKMQTNESITIASLATKMRFTQQSTIDKTAKKAGVGKKPWEVET